MDPVETPPDNNGPAGSAEELPSGILVEEGRLVSLKILLADDSMTAQNMGKKILADAGYEVIAVSNGAAAIKKIAETKPDLLILDIYMPGYSGLEVCEKIKKAKDSAATPVLLTVGKLEPYRPEDGAKVSADGVIVKPFEATDLIAAVGKFAAKIVPAKPTPEPAVETPNQDAEREALEEFASEPGTVAQPESAAAMAVAASAPAFLLDEIPATPVEDVQEITIPNFTVNSEPTAPEANAGFSAATEFGVTPEVSAEAPAFGLEDTQPITPYPTSIFEGSFNALSGMESSEYTLALEAPASNAPTFEVPVQQPEAEHFDPVAALLATAGMAPVETSKVDAQLPTYPVPAESSESTFELSEPTVDTEPQLEPTRFEVPAVAAVETPADVEFNAAPPVSGIPLEQLPELETTEVEQVVEVPAAIDPALVTDPSEIQDFAVHVAKDEAPAEQETEFAATLSGEDTLGQREEAAKPPAGVAFASAIATESAEEHAAEPQLVVEEPQHGSAAVEAAPEPVAEVAAEAVIEPELETAPEPASYVSEPVADVAIPSTPNVPSEEPLEVIQVPPVVEVVEETPALDDSSQIEAAVSTLGRESAAVDESATINTAPSAAQVTDTLAALGGEVAPQTAISQHDQEVAVAMTSAIDSMTAQVAESAPLAQAAPEGSGEPSQTAAAESDGSRIASVVQSVFDRYREKMIADIVRELEK